MTDADRQKRRYDRKKTGLVLFQEWVPATALDAVREAVAEVLAERNGKDE